MTEVLAISIGVALAGGLVGLAFGCIIGSECSPKWDLLRKLEKENAELKEKLAEVNLNGNIVLRELTKAKEIIRDLLGCFFYLFEHDNKTRGHIKINNAIEQAEQFIKEIEK